MVTSATPSPPTRVAGPEVVGRTLAVWDSKRMEWPKAVVTGFNASTGKHQIKPRARDAPESWVDLARTRFQWVGRPQPGAAPNPTAARAPSDPQALVGARVKVFWPGMAKWYLGKVVGYDAPGKRHVVKYRDGDEQRLQLRHEAVIYLDASKRRGREAAEQAKPDSPPAKRARRAPAEASPRPSARPPKPSPPLSAQKKGREAAQSGSARTPKDARAPHARANASPASSAPGTSASAGSSAPPSSSAAASSVDVSGSTGPPPRGPRPKDSFDSATSSDNQAARSSATGPDSGGKDTSGMEQGDDPQGSGNSWEGESPGPSRGKRRAGSEPRSPPANRAGQGKGAAAGAGRPGPGQHKPRRGPGAGSSPSPTPTSPAGVPGIAAVGARVALLGRDDPFAPGSLSPDAAALPPAYRGRLVQYDSYHKRYKIAYDEGTEEWVSLLRERFWIMGPRAGAQGTAGAAGAAAPSSTGAAALSSSGPLLSAGDQGWAALAGQGAANARRTGAAQTPAWLAACSCPASDDELGGAPLAEQAFPAPGEALAVLCAGDARWYYGCVAARQASRALVLFADGEDEWVATGSCVWRALRPEERESAAWRHACPAPSASAAVGWRVALYRDAEQRFVPGKVTAAEGEGGAVSLEVALSGGEGDRRVERVCVAAPGPASGAKSPAAAGAPVLKWISPACLVLRRATPRAGDGEGPHGGAFSPRAAASPGAGALAAQRSSSGGGKAKRLPSVSRLAIAGGAHARDPSADDELAPLGCASPRAEPAAAPRLVRSAALAPAVRSALGSFCALAAGSAGGDAGLRPVTVRVYLSSSSSQSKAAEASQPGTPVGSPPRSGSADVPRSPFQSQPQQAARGPMVMSAAA